MDIRIENVAWFIKIFFFLIISFFAVLRLVVSATRRHTRSQLLRTHRNMTSLVKSSKTFHLSGGLNWRDIKNKVEGVTFIDDRRVAMVFRNKAKETSLATTTLLGSNDFPGVKTCSLYEPSFGESGNGDDGHDTEIVRDLIRASGMKKNRIIASSCDFSVFRIDIDVSLDVHRCYQSLRQRASSISVDGDAVDQRRPACVVMDLELDDALYITHDRVVWRISDTVPQTILVSVEGKGPSEARVLVNKSRKMIRLF